MSWWWVAVLSVVVLVAALVGLVIWLAMEVEFGSDGEDEDNDA